MVSNSVSTRNLSKNELAGVIFGCTNSTMRECLVTQLFGLPGSHFSYVKNIEPGLPIFLLNYSDRKLYGIFEAESHGQLNINPYGWSSNGSEKTKYPAQVRIRTRTQCDPLLEKKFKPIIFDNYHTPSRFWFELDLTQARALISLFHSSPVIDGSLKWSTLPKVGSDLDAALVDKDLLSLVSKADFDCLDESNMKLGSLSATPSLDEENQISMSHSDKEVDNEEQLIYLKLKKMSLERGYSNSSPMDHATDTSVPRRTDTMQSEDECSPAVVSGAAKECDETSAFDLLCVVHKLKQGMEELKVFSQAQLLKMSVLEKKMVESDLERQKLKDRVRLLESRLDPSTTCVDETLADSFDEQHIRGDELIFLLGGYNGDSCLSALDCYSPSRDIVKSLRPMSTIRSHAAAAVLNDRIYIFGGGNGDEWYDIVESYDPLSDEWTSCPSLNVQKGNLAGATLHGGILFAIGGGTRVECLSDVEMFDPTLGRWIRTQSLLQKRFAPASTELNGAVYAVGGYDGKNYLKSAERFDAREHSWKSIESMNIRRGSHSLVAFNEKLYAFGGHDGTGIVASVEVFDPRMNSWTMSEPMNRSRGYAAAAVIGGSIYVMGGVQNGHNIVDSVERYKEDSGWMLTNSKAIGKRCFFSAVVL